MENDEMSPTAVSTHEHKLQIMHTDTGLSIS